MKKAKELNVPLSFHEEDPAFISENGINAGAVAKELGITGSPALAEDSLVARDCMIALHTGASVNIQHISSATSVKACEACERAWRKCDSGGHTSPFAHRLRPLFRTWRNGEDEPAP